MRTFSLHTHTHTHTQTWLRTKLFTLLQQQQQQPRRNQQQPTTNGLTIYFHALPSWPGWRKSPPRAERWWPADTTSSCCPSATPAATRPQQRARGERLAPEAPWRPGRCLDILGRGLASPPCPATGRRLPLSSPCPSRPALPCWLLAPKERVWSSDQRGWPRLLTTDFRAPAWFLAKAAWPTYPYVRAQELCESRGGRPGLPVPSKPYGFCGRKAILNYL